MIFTEFRFLAFFLLVFGVHWALSSQRARKAWLLLCSYAFYAAWDGRLLSLIVASTAVDWVAAARIGGSGDARVRRRWLVTSLVVNLGLLATFKYLGFFTESAAELLRWLGFRADLPVLELVLPVGISFYTFQSLSYTLDVHGGRLERSRSPLDFALFVSFFPQLVAGPIVRAVDFLPQLGVRRRLEEVRFRPLLVLFLAGFFKKAVVSDNVAPACDAFFANPGAYDLAGTWFHMALFSLQLYGDFSGYSDMAIACAGMLGYTLRPNFDFPYLASDLTDFWRRWHMSLGTWMRDYLYRPLRARWTAAWGPLAAVVTTMFLGGLWHGAAWHFVAWGLLHGAGLVVVHAWTRGRVAEVGVLRRLVGTAVTYAFVTWSMLFFRAETIGDAWSLTRRAFGGGAPGPRTPGWPALAIVAGLAVAHVLASRRVLARAVERAPDWAFATACGAAFPVLFAAMNGAVQPFIYFQF